jgi:small subunit ribosomal protein S14
MMNEAKISVAKTLFILILVAPMAKTCWLERNKRKQKTVEKYAKLREELKANHDYIGLSMLPRDASPTRLINRCRVSGRRRAYMRRFQMSRLTFREMALAGMIPGVTKSSW